MFCIVELQLLCPYLNKVIILSKNTSGNSCISYVHVPVVHMSIVIYIATTINSSLFPLTKYPLLLNDPMVETVLRDFIGNHHVVIAITSYNPWVIHDICFSNNWSSYSGAVDPYLSTKLADSMVATRLSLCEI